LDDFTTVKAPEKTAREIHRAAAAVLRPAKFLPPVPAGRRSRFASAGLGQRQEYQ
jgi:hypothetical protein